MNGVVFVFQTVRPSERRGVCVSDTVDMILSEDDLNNDGYLSYYEFIESRNHNQE